MRVEVRAPGLGETRWCEVERHERVAAIKARVSAPTATWNVRLFSLSVVVTWREPGGRLGPADSQTFAAELAAGATIRLIHGGRVLHDTETVDCLRGAVPVVQAVIRRAPDADPPRPGPSPSPHTPPSDTRGAPDSLTARVDSLMEWVGTERLLALGVVLLWLLRSSQPQWFDNLATGLLIFVTVAFVAITSTCFQRVPGFLR